MLVTLKGLVLRDTVAAENAKYITLLTAERGRISVLVRGSTKLRSRFTSATQIFCYSEFTLYEHNGKYTLNEVSLIENYFYICEDFDKMTLGTYVLNTVEYIAAEEQPEPELLRLALNTLWALTHKKDYEIRLIKGAYEMRLAAIEGFAPNLVCCQCCGHAVGEDDLFLNVMEGYILCRPCQNGHQKEIFIENERPVDRMNTAQIILPLAPASVLAMQHAIYAEMGRLFSFSLAPELVPEFAGACEKYLENHVDHHFAVLDMMTN
ncbi:MAG: DNA repair protein RecO [Ruminococcaceae bacterium]|nr:DNA repair protein RecO [Oscillospiraceae bacterium]